MKHFSLPRVLPEMSFPMFLRFAIAAVVAAPSILLAQTNFSGGIYSNTTWTKANSPYVLTGSVVVFPGKTLTIQPGVVVQMQSNPNLPNDYRYLEVRGTLNALGTSSDPIVFEGLNADTNVTWNGIRVVQSQGGTLQMDRFELRNAWNGIEGEQDSNRLYWNNCVFEYNHYAIRIGSALELNQCRFYKNEYAVLGSNTTATPSLVRSSVFRKNNVAFQGYPNFWLDQCVLDSNQMGFYFNTGYWYMPAKFTGNTFAHNFTAVATPHQSQFRGNFFDGNTFGITGCVDCNLDSNLFANNDLGVGIYGQSWFANNQVLANKTGLVVGKAAWPGSPGNPTVVDNQLCGNLDYNVANGGNANLDLDENCFCLSDSAAIDAKIFDGYDDITLGLINFAVYDTSCTVVQKRVIKVNTASVNELETLVGASPNPATQEVSLDAVATEVKAMSADGRLFDLPKKDEDGLLWSVEQLPAGIYQLLGYDRAVLKFRTRLAVVH
jgi:hypothetical protein